MGKRILLVEDNPGDARLIEKLLEGSIQEDFQVKWVKSIQEAAKYLKIESYEAILLDLTLPDGKGYATFQRVAKMRPELPVIVLTGWDDSNMGLQAVSEGAQDYLIKGSFEKNHLQKTLLHSIERHRLRIQLEKSESRFKRMIEQNADGMLILDSDHNITYANPASEKLFNKGFADLRGESFSYPTLENGTGEIEIVGKDKKPIYLEIRTSETNWDGNAATLVSLRDVTDRIVADQKARLSAKVLESTADGVMITNLDSKIIQVNSAFTNITGYSFNEVIEKTPNILNSGHHEASFFKKMWEDLLTDGSWSGEIWNRRKDGQIYPQSTSINVVKDDAGRTIHYVAVFSDISHSKQVEEQLRFLATHDQLTKLPNRSVFGDRLKHALERARRNSRQAAVMFLDMNKFKVINDEYGHAIGDQVLCAIGTRLMDCMRKSDTVSRLGGDEFTVLLEDIKDGADCETVAVKILEAISQPIEVDEFELSVRASIGISVFPDDAGNSEELLKQADFAMYQAKKEGKGYQFFNTDMG